MTTNDRSSLVLIDLGPGGASPAAIAPSEQQVLDRINQKVAGPDSLETLVDFLFDAVQPLFDCDRVGVSFLEEDGARLVSYHNRTSYEPVILRKGYSEELAGSSLAGVIASGRPRIIRDLEQYLAQRPESPSTRILVREGVRSSMTCPLMMEQRIVGLLFFSSRRPGAYTEHHVRLHLAIAERLGQAVDKARRIQQLADANRAYFEMLGFVSHELKSPLASIIMDAGLLTGGYIGDLPEPQRRIVEKMVGKADYLLNLIREYLDLARLEGGELAIHPRDGVHLTVDVLDPAWDIVKPQADQKQMPVEREYAEAVPHITCDPDLMRIVAVNLLGNAVKYGRDKGLVRIRTEPTRRGFAFGVWNEGPGFPANQRQRLFRKFSRLDTPELRRRKGTGVGLYTSWRIVTLHGGRIHATSEEGAWAEFRVEIPQPLVPAGRATP